MVLKNFFLTTLVRCVKGFYQNPDSKRQQRFLIVSTTGLGDTLWATPALRSLRQAHPSSYIAVLTSPIGASIFKGNPHIDEIFSLSDPALPDLFSLFSKIRSRRIHTALIFHISQRPLLPFCYLVGIQEIIGTQGLCKGLDHLLTKSIPFKPQHEIFRRLAIVECVGAQPHSLQMEIFLHEEDVSTAMQFLHGNQLSLKVPIIGLHPGAKNLFKQWHPEGFIALGQRLVKEKKCQIVVSGNIEEKHLVCRIANQIPGAIPLYGQLNIPQLAALQKKMMLFITNDTGPMHLAAAVGTPVLALFGPTNPLQCGPLTSPLSSQVITLKPTCTPCLQKNCKEPFCLLQITADQVFQQALRFLR